MDTGAACTTLPGALLRGLGIEPVGKHRFLLTNRRRIEMDYGEARATVDGESVTTLVVFGEDNASADCRSSSSDITAPICTAHLNGWFRAAGWVVRSVPSPTSGKQVSTRSAVMYL